MCYLPANIENLIACNTHETNILRNIYSSYQLKYDQLMTDLIHEYYLKFHIYKRYIIKNKHMLNKINKRIQIVSQHKIHPDVLIGLLALENITHSSNTYVKQLYSLKATGIYDKELIHTYLPSKPKQTHLKKFIMNSMINELKHINKMNYNTLSIHGTKL